MSQVDLNREDFYDQDVYQVWVDRLTSAESKTPKVVAAIDMVTGTETVHLSRQDLQRMLDAIDEYESEVRNVNIEEFLEQYEGFQMRFDRYCKSSFYYTMQGTENELYTLECGDLNGIHGDEWDPVETVSTDLLGFVKSIKVRTPSKALKPPMNF